MSPEPRSPRTAWPPRLQEWARRASAELSALFRLSAHRIAAGAEYVRLRDAERRLRAKLALLQTEVGRLVIEIHREAGDESGFTAYPEIKSELERVIRVERALRNNAARAERARARLRSSPDA